MHDKIVKIMCETFNISPDQAPLIAYGDQEWDSLAHMDLITAVEEAFDIELDEDQMLQMTSLNNLLKLVQAII
jgi:acyl carrier protein